MDRIFNFSAGPAILPAEVLQQARDEMLDWHGSSMSVMEMSHRGLEFMSIAEKVESDLRELASIPVNYKILFLSGGASSQFAMVPMNRARLTSVCQATIKKHLSFQSKRCFSAPPVFFI